MEKRERKEKENGYLLLVVLTDVFPNLTTIFFVIPLSCSDYQIDLVGREVLCWPRSWKGMSGQPLRSWRVPSQSCRHCCAVSVCMGPCQLPLTIRCIPGSYLPARESPGQPPVLWIAWCLYSFHFLAEWFTEKFGSF